MKVAIAGCKHFHISMIAKYIKAHSDLELVALAENAPEQYAPIVSAIESPLLLNSVDELFDKADFDILAVGDAFGLRGPHAIRALEAGKHVLSDKPLCTRLEEIRRVRALSEEKNLSVIVALTLRYTSPLITARNLLLDGAVGEIVTVNVLGHHPLGYKTDRPDWYFEPGLHGGTINDLMIHATDSLAWMTGHPVAEVVAARAWNAELPKIPFFQDVSLAFLKLSNGAGVLIDASYKSPVGYPSPWRFDFYGTGGRLIVNIDHGVTVQRHHKPEEKIPSGPGNEGGFVADLVAEITGDTSHTQTLTTPESLDATEKTLKIQAAADDKQTHLEI